MRPTAIKPTHGGSEIFPEQFIPDHVFVYIVRGRMHCYDGNQSQILRPGDYYLFRKNHLVKYYGESERNELEFIRICLEETFLKQFQEKHKPVVTTFKSAAAFWPLNKMDLMPDFISSLKPYYHQHDINEAFADVKQEELLLILLQSQPELAGVLFTYGNPAKIDLAAFMNHNYKFNVSLERFAYLTGRSLSAFKRDFKQVFQDTPNHWLVNRRLQESHFLIDQRNKKPSEIYLDLGFEDLSHFSHAFRKRFGLTPTELSAQKKNNSRSY